MKIYRHCREIVWQNFIRRVNRADFNQDIGLRSNNFFQTIGWKM